MEEFCNQRTPQLTSQLKSKFVSCNLGSMEELAIVPNSDQFLMLRPRRFLIRVLGNQGSGKVVARLLVARGVKDKRQKVSSL